MVGARRKGPSEKESKDREDWEGWGNEPHLARHDWKTKHGQHGELGPDFRAT